MISGIDLSEKNGAPDWDELGHRDVGFAYIKASEALDSADRNYQSNRDQAEKKGILVGAYHWLHPRLHVGQQAEFFLSAAGRMQGMLPPVVCLHTHRAPAEEIEQNIHTFLQILENKSGHKAIIYTSGEYWEKYMPDAGWACDYRLWIDSPGTVWPKQQWPWAGWTFWQTSYKTRLPGVSTQLGLNWFNGSQKELEALVIQ